MGESAPTKRAIELNPDFLSPFVAITLDSPLAGVAAYYLEKDRLQAVEPDKTQAPSDDLRLRERVFCIMRTFEDIGCAARHTDSNGNITFNSTPQLFLKVKFDVTKPDITGLVTIFSNFAIQRNSRREISEAVKKWGEDVVCDTACEIFREGGTPCPDDRCDRRRDYGGETCRDVCRWLIWFFSRHP
jgi:hypothetical protein